MKAARRLMSPLRPDANSHAVTPLMTMPSAATTMTVTDVLGLVIGWVATVLARRAPSRTYTYGLRRGTILAALANAVLLLVTVGAIAVEGVRRQLQNRY